MGQFNAVWLEWVSIQTDNSRLETSNQYGWVMNLWYTENLVGNTSLDIYTKIWHLIIWTLHKICHVWGIGHSQKYNLYSYVPSKIKRNTYMNTTPNQNHLGTHSLKYLSFNYFKKIYFLIPFSFILFFFMCVSKWHIFMLVTKQVFLPKLITKFHQPPP